jgi:rhodanese-related sulfurtransferase
MINAGGRTVIDVRTPEEFAAGHVAGALNYDVNGAAFSDQIAELDPEAPVLVYCRSGNRSAQAASQMEDIGIVDIADAGGLADLAAAGAPVE